MGSDNRVCTNSGALDAHEMLVKNAHLLLEFSALFRGLNTLWSGPGSDLSHILVHQEQS